MPSPLDEVRIGETLDVAALAYRSSSVLEKLRQSARSARSDERREPTFPIGKAGELVGRTTAAIREAENDGRLVAPTRGENNRRLGYSLADVNRMREVFGTLPHRAPDDPPEADRRPARAAYGPQVSPKAWKAPGRCRSHPPAGSVAHRGSRHSRRQTCCPAP